MNCAEFRERLLIDPHDPAMAVAAQAGICPDAELQLKRALGFERRLRDALELDVPPGLADSIRAAVQQQSPSTRRSRRTWLALAASIMLGTTVAGWWMSQDPTHLLASECVAHLAHDPYALTRNKDVPANLVNRMFGEFGVALKGDPGALQYSTPCKVGNLRALHMVVQLASGPVTVMYLSHPPRVHRSDFREDAVTGRIVPMGDGALVLLAENADDFDPLEMRFRSAIEGPNALAGGI